jgi:hypothetical protein
MSFSKEYGISWGLKFKKMTIMAHQLTLRADSKIADFSVAEVVPWALKTAIGGGASGVINQLISSVPRHVQGIDKEADPFLERIITRLEKLAENWKEKAEPDPKLLDDLIEGLTEFVRPQTSRSTLLFPYIMNAKPTATTEIERGKQQEEIDRKKLQVEEKISKLLKDLVSPLQVCLLRCKNVSINPKPDPKAVLALIGELKLYLDGIVHEQRSPVARVIHMVANIVKRTLTEAWDGMKHRPKETFSFNSHPLMKLLGVMGKYQSRSHFLPSDKREEILKALRHLDTYCPLFAEIFNATKAAHNSENLETLHKMVTQFIRAQVLEKLGEKRLVVYLQAANFAKLRKKELIEAETLEARNQKIERESTANKKLQNDYKRIETDGQSAGIMSVGGGKSEAARKKETQKQALTALLQQEEEIDQQRNKAIAAIESHCCWDGLDRDSQKFGEAICLGQLRDVPPKFFREPTQDEILWKAVAFQQQHEEWAQLTHTIMHLKIDGSEGIRDSFKFARIYLEKFASLHQGLDQQQIEASLKFIENFILHAMDFAKRSMLSHTQDSWERTNVTAAFDKAVQALDKGDPLSCIDYILTYIQTSNYWKKIWKDTPSPLGNLTDSFGKFIDAPTPPKPPKQKNEALKAAGQNEGAAWRHEFLVEANKNEKEKVLENALAFVCFQFVAQLIGIKKEQKIPLYKGLMRALEQITAHYQTDPTPTILLATAMRMKEILGKLLGIAFVKFTPKEQKMVDSLMACVAAKSGKKGEFHKDIYLQLINIFIEVHGKSKSPAAWAAWASFTSVYDLIELFIRPLSEKLFTRIDEVVANASGLNEKYLVPIVGITNALSTYIITLNSWAEEIKKQNNKQRTGLTGRKEHDMAVLLNGPNSYEGMTPQEITLKMGYALVDKIKLPNYSRAVATRIQRVWNWALMGRTTYRTLNASIILGQLILSAVPLAPLAALFCFVKAFTMVANFAIQKSVKFYLWKTNKISEGLDEVLDALLVDAKRPPIFDTILIEQLEDLLFEMEKGIPPENPKTAAGDERNKKVLSEALQHLIELIELDKYESVNSFSERSKDGPLQTAKKLAYEQLKKLLSTVLNNLAKTLLQKDPVDALLFDIFNLANEGLEGGKKIVLTPEQKVDLARKLGKVDVEAKRAVDQLTDDEIDQEGLNIEIENLKKIPKILAKIQEKAIYPALDKGIDQLAQTESRLLLDYITWLQGRLFADAENVGKPSIIQTLAEKLDDYEKKPDKSDVIRQIHISYAKFIQEMKDFQLRLDAHPSPNSPEFNQFILKELVPAIKALTDELTALMIKHNNPHESLANVLQTLQRCKNRLRDLAEKHVKVRLELGKIEEAEKNRVMGMHSGIQGVVVAALSESLPALKHTAKEVAHGIVQWQTDQKVDQARDIYKNRPLIKHAILWQMRLFLNPELAFKNSATR